MYSKNFQNIERGITKISMRLNKEAPCLEGTSTTPTCKHQTSSCLNKEIGVHFFVSSPLFSLIHMTGNGLFSGGREEGKVQQWQEEEALFSVQPLNSMGI